MPAASGLAFASLAAIGMLGVALWAAMPETGTGRARSGAGPPMTGTQPSSLAARTARPC